MVLGSEGLAWRQWGSERVPSWAVVYKPELVSAPDVRGLNRWVVPGRLWMVGKGRVRPTEERSAAVRLRGSCLRLQTHCSPWACTVCLPVPCDGRLAVCALLVFPALDLQFG